MPCILDFNMTQEDKILTFPRRSIPHGWYLPSWGCWEISGGSHLRSVVPSHSGLKHRAMNQTYSNSFIQLRTIKLVRSMSKVIGGSRTVQYQFFFQTACIKIRMITWRWMYAFNLPDMMCFVSTSLAHPHSLTMKYFNVDGCGQTGNVVVAGKRQDHNWDGRITWMKQAGEGSCQ